MTVLQPRDAALIEKLSRLGVLSTRQIADQFFNGVAHTTVMRRLRKLETLGLILRREGLPDSQSAWCITQEAGSTLGIENVPHYSNRNVIQHEVKLSGVRIALESVGLGESWTSETELRRKIGYTSDRDSLVVPDGLFVAKRESKPCVIALELELNAKAHVRYNHILNSYRTKSSISYLWYLVPQLTIADVIFRRLKSMSDAKFTLIATLVDELLTDPETARVFTADTKEVALKHFFDLPNVHASAQGLSTQIPARQSAEKRQILVQNQALPATPT